jgi:small subunit ribosomal protein S17
MSEEDKKEQEETTEPEATEEEAPQAEEAPSESVAPEVEDAEPAAEDAEAPAAAQKPERAGSGAEGGATGEEVLSPKELRKRRRSHAPGPARPSRSPEERAADRVERRSSAAKERSRHRAAKRAKRGEPGSGTPPAEREAGTRKVRQGSVVSTSGDKTITVEIAVVRRHPTYEKVVRRTSRLHAHDEANEAGTGDVVRVVECRPVSRTKRWRLLEVLERAPR